MHEQLTALPEVFQSGTQVEYRRSYDHFPATDGWTLALHLAGKSAFTKAFSPLDSGFQITLTAAETAALLPGTYQWEERATKAGAPKTADCGSVALRPNLATAIAGSLESRASKMLTAVRAAIDLRLGIGGTPTDAVESYTIGDRSLTKVALPVLLDMEARLAMAVRREENPGEWGPQVQVHFTRPA